MKVGEGKTRCYWLEPTGTARLVLRRFTFEDVAACASSERGHDASITTNMLLPVVYRDTDNGKILERVPDSVQPPRSSPMWPRRCEHCEQAFPRGDKTMWQTALALGYTRSDTGETVWSRHIMGVEFAGALYNGEWLKGTSRQKKDYGDGIALIAICPNGAFWEVDGPAGNGDGWKRVGDPRKPETLTVSPSIIAGDYHGFLQGGVFTPHIG